MQTLFLDQTDSTQDYAKKKLIPTEKIQCIVAKNQTKARGTRGKTWICDQGIYATFYFLLKDFSLLVHLPQILSLSVVKTLQTFAIPAYIKWPNDIRIQKKKLAGVLCEAQKEKKFYKVYLGLGLNLSLTEKHQKEINQPVCDLHAYIDLSYEQSLTKILTPIQKTFLDLYQQSQRNGFLSLAQEYYQYQES